MTSIPQHPPSEASMVSTGLGPTGAAALSMTNRCSCPTCASNTSPVPSTVCSTTRAWLAIADLRRARDRIVRRAAGRRERQVQLLVRQHLAAVEDLRRVVLEHEMDQVVEADL